MRENIQRITRICRVGLLDILFPRRCMLCDGLLSWDERGIHRVCERQLVRIGEPVCMHCGKPVESESYEYCYDCRRDMASQVVSFCQGKALYLYQGPMKKAMYRFKYSNKREYGEWIAREWVKCYGTWIMERHIEAIIPVPMYLPKERKRGYNQAAVLAKWLVEVLAETAESTGLKRHMVPCYEPHLVKRVINTRPMKELCDVERKNNLKNALQTGEKVVKYKRILVIDDIYTTGSTMNAVSEVLYLAGVQEVYTLSVCIGRGL